LTKGLFVIVRNPCFGRKDVKDECLGRKDIEEGRKDGYQVRKKGRISRKEGSQSRVFVLEHHDSKVYLCDSFHRKEGVEGRHGWSLMKAEHGEWMWLVRVQNNVGVVA
jgi:hypothetical protein